MKLNTATRCSHPTTHEGRRAERQTPIKELKRSVLSCLLWEDSFYESGVSVAERIVTLIPKCKPEDVAKLAIQARSEYKLRHVPLLLVRELARDSSKFKVADTLAAVIQRADELTEFLAIYWKDGKTPLSGQVKKGLRKAFVKFNPYQLAKYNRDGAIKLRDVLFLVSPKPTSDEQQESWNNLVAGTLESPDTWEVELSAGKDKKETFTRLLSENKLGYMALLRNLRNMKESGVDSKLVFEKLISGAKSSKALPFRFIAAARAVPSWESKLNEAMGLSMEGLEKLSGTTAVMVDVSGSMESKLSEKSDLTRLDAACALAALLRGICENCEVYSFSAQLKEVPVRSGMALMDGISNSQRHSGTYLGKALEDLKKRTSGIDRLVVITDEQSRDRIGSPIGKGYMINVAHYQNGIAFGDWVQINGFSEAVVKFISEVEKC